MIDAIDELVAHSEAHVELTKFHVFHRAHPEVLDFLTREINALVEAGRRSFSIHSLWH